MKLFIDSNVFIAAVTGEEDRSDAARELLNMDAELYTSVLNIMEIRSVLSKKKNFSMEALEEVEQEVIEGVEVVIPDSSDFMEANERQAETLLYPFDSLVLTLADVHDSELTDNGAKTPEEVREEIT